VDRGYGIFLPVGLIGGVAVGLALGEPSAGAVIGLGLAGLAAIAMRLARRN
jgi:hypothetical protein